MKLKWKKCCVLSTAGVDIDDGSPNNIISTIKDTKFYDLVVTLTAREIRNYQNILAKDLKGKFIGMNTKQKVRIKIQQMNIDIFSNETLLESSYLL